MAKLGPPAPAVVEFVAGSITCTTDGMGACVLSGRFKVKRTDAEAICGGPEVRVNGATSGDVHELAGSPVKDVATGLWIHTYDWANGGPVACGGNLQIRAQADICIQQNTTEVSPVELFACPPC
jgi:hypothetical protein